VHVGVEVVRTAGIQAGVVVCLDSAVTPANFLIAYLDGAGNMVVDKCVAGTYTNLISAAVTYSAGKEIKLVKDGTTVRAFYNDLAVGTVQTVSDAGIISNTKHGLFSTFVSNTFDNFSAWDINSSYGILDRYIRE